MVPMGADFFSSQQTWGVVGSTRLMNRFWLFLIPLYLGMLPSLVQAQPASPSLRFQFREPRPTAYRVETNPFPTSAASPQWLKGWSDTSLTDVVEFGSRVVESYETAENENELRGMFLLPTERLCAGIHLFDFGRGIAFE